MYTDPKGLDYGFWTDPAGAQGNGHTTLYFQDGSSNWNSYNQGTTDPSALASIPINNVPGGVNIQRLPGPVALPPPGAVIFPSNNFTDTRIAACASASQQSHASGSSSYNLVSNNCTDAAVDVVQCGGGSVPNSPFTVRPNSWFDQLNGR